MLPATIGALGWLVIVFVLFRLGRRKRGHSTTLAPSETDQDPIDALIDALDRNTRASEALTAEMRTVYTEAKARRIDASHAAAKARLSMRESKTSKPPAFPEGNDSQRPRDTVEEFTPPEMESGEGAAGLARHLAIPPPPMQPEEHHAVS